MANETVIRHGLIINNSQAVTGITNNSALTSNSQYNLVTEYAIKGYVDNKTYSINDLTDLNISAATNGQTLVYDNGFWINSASTQIDLSNYYTKSEVYNTGETYTNSQVDSLLLGYSLTSHTHDFSSLTGINLTNPLINEFLIYDGSNWVNSAFTVDLSNYYTKTEVYNTGETYTNSQVDNLLLSYSLTGHTHVKANITNFVEADYVHTTGDETIYGDKYFKGNITIESGTTINIKSQNLNIFDNLITINSGETGSGVTLNVAGILVDRGLYEAYTFIFSEDTDTFRVGASSSTQAVATREDTPTANGLAIWNNILSRFDTSTSITFANDNLSISSTINNINFTNFYQSFTAHTHNLSSLTDVSISNPQSNEFLRYNGSAWINSAFTIDLNNYYTKSYVDDLIIKISNTNLSSNTVVDRFTGDTFNGCVWYYSVSDGFNMRTGQIMAAWDGATQPTYNETSTTSVGNTNDVDFNVSANTTEIKLNTTISSGTWKIVVSRFEL